MRISDRQKIKVRMAELGLNAKTLAEKEGFSESTLSRLFGGKLKPGINIMKKLAHGLGFELVEVFKMFY